MYGLANPVLAGGTVPRVWVVRSRKGGRLQRPFQTVSKVAQSFSARSAWLSGLVTTRRSWRAAQPGMRDSKAEEERQEAEEERQEADAAASESDDGSVQLSDDEAPPPAAPPVARPPPRRVRRPLQKPGAGAFESWLKQQQAENANSEEPGASSAPTEEEEARLKRLSEELAAAAAAGSAEEVSRLLADGGPVSSESERSQRNPTGARSDVMPVMVTPLHCAAQSGHEACVSILLDAKADVEARFEPLKMTPLHLAAIFGRDKCVARLAAAKADLESLARDSWASGSKATPKTPLLMATCREQVESARALLAAKAQADHADGSGKTALMWAQTRDSAEAIEALTNLLLDHGVTGPLRARARGSRTRCVHASHTLAPH